ncbi:hypothetical protein M011DRAFT_409519 [Sporormia fimetaria CBS 119925]|uniref:Clr5 domain-containing protein n=1 Tax=Sporormia fimetaria CBS 119925 TaxID=1340428 RepID=A0A6A6V1W6_9PLEO|nr:hypothetical protein M011DRAFT_409519 [Sporormia fimetaria CBS 119925]
MPSSFPSPEEVRTDARRCADKLFRDYDTLQDIVQRHEDTIRKRWNKKSNVQRKNILQEAWPNMPARHRPDVAAWKAHSKEKMPFMWPSINLEDLTKPRNMLIFLHARGRHPPSEFVHADLERAKFGEKRGVTMPAFLNDYTMYFHDRHTPSTYGELVSWDDDDDSFEDMTNGMGMHPGHGLQALEIQQRIYSFLVKWCRLLLRDIEDLTASDVVADPGPPKDVLKESGITSLEVMSMEAQYAVPGHLDFKRLKGILAAERNSREDHVWTLREDPSYFAEIMQGCAEHRQEMILDTNGRKHPTLTQPGQALFWNRVLGNVVLEAHFNLATFDSILKQVEVLEEMYDTYKNTLKPNKDLPAKFFKAFQDVRFTLEAIVTDYANALKMAFFPSPPMRRYCFREPQRPDTTKMQVGFDPSNAPRTVRDLVAMVSTLFNPKDIFLMGLHTVTDELEHMLRSDDSVGSLISPYVAARLSTLSVISECLHQLHLFQPWARKIEDDMEENSGEVRSRYQQRFSDWTAVIPVNFERTQMYQLADPTDEKFSYPIYRRRNNANIDRLRRSEANLDALWEAVDQHYKTNARGKSQQDLIAHLLGSDRTLQRTAPWVDQEKTKENKKPQEEEGIVNKPFSLIFHDRTNKVVSDFNRASLSDKPPKLKTRGTPASANGELATEIPHTTDAALIAKKYIVDKRAHKVFKALFHSPYNPNLPGEIPWLDFIHAMVTMGFEAEKAHGSAWNFYPKKVNFDVERSIQFHEPHPEKKIPFRVSRRYGRRLNRAYGWSGEMFVLA